MVDPLLQVIKWLFVLCFLGASTIRSTAADEEYKLVCYYANWAIYRPGLAKFTPENINPGTCTHLIYAFAGMNKNYELKPFDSYNDIQLGNYKKFTNLKNYNPKLKVLIAVGGWNEGSKRFSKMVESGSSRLSFVRGAISFLRKHNFDGLDLDWEYPASRDGGRDEDKEGYAKLVQELREAFDSESVPRGKSRLLLTMAVPAGKDTIDKGYDVPTLSRHLDFLNLLTYDYHTSHEATVQHHAPLGEEPGLEEWSPNRQLNIEWTVNYYVKLGADRKKLVLGVPTYGRSWTLVDPEETELGSPAEGPGEKGNSTREPGYLAYYEICQMIQDHDWELEAPYPEVMGPYAYKDNQWVGFDDEDIIVEKAKFIVREGLGGGMVWTLDNDDFRGKCYGEQSPLINALKAALAEGRGLLDQKPPEKASSSSTAAPFTTPDPGAPFECEDEGFFNNPADCKKYFWCLDSGPSNLGLVAHAFTCPSGLYFNKQRDSCDYAANVVCRAAKKTTTTAAPTTKRPKPRPKARPKPKARATTTTTTTTTERPPKAPTEIKNSLEAIPKEALGIDGQDLSELLKLIQKLGINQIHDRLHGRAEEGPSTAAGPTRTLPQYRTPSRPATAASGGDLFNQYAKPDRTAKNQDEDDGAEEAVKPRGPQYHLPPPEAEEDEDDDDDSRATTSSEDSFPFVYQTPSRLRGPQNAEAHRTAEDDEEEDDPTTTRATQRPNRRVVVRLRPAVPGGPAVGQGDQRARRPVKRVRVPDQETGRRNYVLAQTVRSEAVRPNDLGEGTTTGRPSMRATRRPTGVSRAPATRRASRPAPTRPPPAPTELVVLPNGRPAVPATTRTYWPAVAEARGPAIALLPDGGLTCLRRGVHPHPADCAKFLVCVPADGGGLDGFIHDCPRGTLFVDSKGRCVPGDCDA